ncbi:MAG: DUF4116 domain-containing protein, partial [Candidatus Marinamargulisbacteria bacterium]|nr:DUF4116 domain-containing protein [Candidatus Marinamargulisbacteria bacterium]
LKDDREVVVAAVSQNGFTLNYASPRLTKKKALIKMANEQRRAERMADKQRMADEDAQPKSLWDQVFLELNNED